MKDKIIIDKSLEKYDGQILFPKKLKEANETLKKIDLTKIRSAK